MNDRTKNVINIFLFTALLIGTLIANIIKPDEVSVVKEENLPGFQKQVWQVFLMVICKRVFQICKGPVCPQR